MNTHRTAFHSSSFGLRPVAFLIPKKSRGHRTPNVKAWEAICVNIFLISLTLILGLTIPPFQSCDALAEESQQDAMGESFASQQEYIKKKFESLLRKMRRLEERIRETEPYYAQKLKEAIARAEEAAIDGDMEKAMKLLLGELSPTKKPSYYEAGAKILEIERELQEILDFLQEKKSIEELKRQLERHKEAAEELKDLIQDQKECKEQTAQAEKDIHKDAHAAMQDIEELRKAQEELKNMTEDLGGTMERQLAEAGNILKQARDRQQELLERTRQTEGELLRQLSDTVNKLADAEARQNEALRESRRSAANQNAIERALHDLGNIIKKEESLASATDAIKSDEKASPFELNSLAKEQNSISRDAQNLSERLDKLAIANPSFQGAIDASRDDLSRAIGHMEAATRSLGQLTPSDAHQYQQKAIGQLKEAEKKLQSIAERFQEEMADSTVRATRAQQEAMKNLNAASRHFESLKSAHPELARDFPSETDAATSSLQSATDSMKNALQSLERQDAAGARKPQEKALEEIGRARRALEDVRDRIAGENADAFERLAEEQSSLSTTCPQARQLLTGAVGRAAQRDTSLARQISDAIADLDKATAAMNDASRSLRQRKPSNAQSQQQQALDSIQKAIDKLEEQKRTLSRKQKPDREELEKRQLELKKKAAELAEKFARQAEKPAPLEKTEGFRRASSCLANATHEMKQAKGHLKSQKFDAARDSQECALRELEKAKKALEDTLKRKLTEEEKRKLEELVRRQDELARRAEGLAAQQRELEKGQEASERSQRAASHMKDASSSLSDGNTCRAQEEQQKAIDELENAVRNLEEKSREYENQRMEQMIQQLQLALQEMLQEQNFINDETIRLDETIRKEGSLAHADRRTLAGLAKKQAALVRKNEEQRKKVEEENATVFDWIMRTIGDDMENSQQLLESQEIGEYTQTVQADIVRKLQDLIDALKQEMNRRKKEGGNNQNQQGGMQGKPRLVPPLAEIKMIRKMEQDLKDRLEDFIQQNEGKQFDELDHIDRMLLERMTGRQAEINNVMEDFIKKIKDEVRQ